MKIHNAIVLVLVLLIPQIIIAQGTLYFSSLSQTSTATVAAGSDSWLAAGFETANNAGGYMLDSVQLGLAGASGIPSGFQVMIYSKSTNLAAVLPGSSLEALVGTPNPSTSGIYTYDDDLNLKLSPQTIYFIVITAGSTVANGSYGLNESAYPASIGQAENGLLYSQNGNSNWGVTPYNGIAQFAIYATPLPEPSAWALLLLGGGVFVYGRRVLGRKQK